MVIPPGLLRNSFLIIPSSTAKTMPRGYHYIGRLVMCPLGCLIEGVLDVGQLEVRNGHAKRPLFHRVGRRANASRSNFSYRAEYHYRK